MLTSDEIKSIWIDTIVPYNLLYDIKCLALITLHPGEAKYCSAIWYVGFAWMWSDQIKVMYLYIVKHNGIEWHNYVSQYI